MASMAPESPATTAPPCCSSSAGPTCFAKQREGNRRGKGKHTKKNQVKGTTPPKLRLFWWELGKLVEIRCWGGRGKGKPSKTQETQMEQNRSSHNKREPNSILSLTKHGSKAEQHGHPMALSNLGHFGHRKMGSLRKGTPKLVY